MKKTTLLFFFLITCFAFSQTSSGVITLETGRSVKFDIDSGVVTMTMVMPENSWLGIGLSPDIALGQGMGDEDDDAIIGLSTGILDRNMNAGTGQPPADNNDWTVVSNSVTSGVRTIVGTRAVNTGSAEDFTFPTTETSFPMIYAKGGSSFGYHGSSGSNTGAAMATMSSTLGTQEFDTPTKFSIFPNPGNDEMNINIPSLSDEGLQLEVFDVLGKRVYTETLSALDTKVSISKWKSGMYLVRLTSSNQDIKLTKRFVKL